MPINERDSHSSIFTPPLERNAIQFALWAISLPILSVSGAIKINMLSNLSSGTSMPLDFTDQNVIIVGSGPSLDLVNRDFFDSYDSVICINFAIKRVPITKNLCFFSTDIGVLVNLIGDTGWEIFDYMGPNHCIIAPICFEQVYLLSEIDRQRFTWVRADTFELKVERARNRKVLGLSGIPYSFRIYPRQIPHVDIAQNLRDRYKRISRISILESTSALSAICYAALLGAKDVDLIGCDFSSGRSCFVQTGQKTPTENTFSGARDSFFYVQDILAQGGCKVRNLSWSVGSGP